MFLPDVLQEGVFITTDSICFPIDGSKELWPVANNNALTASGLTQRFARPAMVVLSSSATVSFTLLHSALV